MQNESTKPPRSRKTRQLSGFWAARRAIQKFGEHVIDGRSRLAHALDGFRDELIADLGGAEAVSQQQRVIVDLAVRTHLMVQSLDSYLLNLPSLVNKRRRQLYPIVRERTALADSLAKYLSQLGLEKRKAPAKKLDQYIFEKREGVADDEHPGSDVRQKPVSTDVQEADPPQG